MLINIKWRSTSNFSFIEWFAGKLWRFQHAKMWYFAQNWLFWLFCRHYGFQNVNFFSLLYLPYDYTTFETKIREIGYTLLELSAKNPDFRPKIQKFGLRKWKWSIIWPILVKSTKKCLVHIYVRNFTRAPNFSSFRRVVFSKTLWRRLLQKKVILLV